MTVPELVRKHASERGTHAALVTWDGGERRSVSYAELHELTDRLALGLGDRGLRPGDRIGICLDNANAGSFYRLMIGAYKASLVPVPINTRLTTVEVSHIISDSGARACVADYSRCETLAPALDPEFDLQDLRLLAELEAVPPTGQPPEYPDLSSLADLMYTSGTTGLPKGSAFRHRSLGLNAVRLAEALRLRSDDVFQTPAPVYTSTGSHTFPLPVLYAGATFVVEPDFSIDAALARLEAERATIFFGVPAMLLLILRRAGSTSFPRLRSLMYGGSPIPEQAIPELLERFPGVGLWNLYGLTEGGPTGCVLEPEQAMTRPGSVGRPVPGTELRIRAEDGSDAGPGEPGEIMLRSETLMDGYHGAPGLSAEVLVDGWLHTGDLGRLDQDGYLTVLGRTKDMIIRGGFNVYPAEIEHVLHDHPAVTEAAVVGIPHDVLGEDPCAVVAFAEGVTPDLEELESFCAERLADYKLPRRWEIVDELPRNTMGKVVKVELRTRYGSPEGVA